MCVLVCVSSGAECRVQLCMYGMYVCITAQRATSSDIKYTYSLRTKAHRAIPGACLPSEISKRRLPAPSPFPSRRVRKDRAGPEGRDNHDTARSLSRFIRAPHQKPAHVQTHSGTRGMPAYARPRRVARPTPARHPRASACGARARRQELLLRKNHRPRPEGGWKPSLASVRTSSPSIARRVATSSSRPS